MGGVGKGESGGLVVGNGESGRVGVDTGTSDGIAVGTSSVGIGRGVTEHVGVTIGPRVPVGVRVRVGVLVTVGVPVRVGVAVDSPNGVIEGTSVGVDGTSLGDGNGQSVGVGHGESSGVGRGESGGVGRGESGGVASGESGGVASGELNSDAFDAAARRTASGAVAAAGRSVPMVPTPASKIAAGIESPAGGLAVHVGVTWSSRGELCNVV